MGSSARTQSLPMQMISSFLASKFQETHKIRLCLAPSLPSNPDVLAKAFQVDDNVVDNLQKQFWYDNN
ncbi:hypothetical protein L3X38_041469 [Prunus dulcis]|uniref:Uncharacterized protein n=1 Tax=Prunus dulcis TaxID=3755 RepID=A0AAD4UUF4_PRUDU|nr:hypothetical protein L3X38_041469 [Prunus dulcis]